LNASHGGASVDQKVDHDTRAKLRRLASEHGLPVLPVTSTLDMAMRLIKGGRAQFLEYVQLACLDTDNPFTEKVQQWWAVWVSLGTASQRRASLDDVCHAAGVAPKAMVQAISGLAFELNCDLSDFLAAVAHPEIVAKTIKIAKTREGVQERRMLLDHAGFLPQPKGTNITLSQRVAMLANGAPPPQLPAEVPSFADDIKRLAGASEVVQQQLEAGVKPADLAIDGEVLLTPIPVKPEKGEV
jgi:hypothetical protein